MPARWLGNRDVATWSRSQKRRRRVAMPARWFGNRDLSWLEESPRAPRVAMPARWLGNRDSGAWSISRIALSRRTSVAMPARWFGNRDSSTMVCLSFFSMSQCLLDGLEIETSHIRFGSVSGANVTMPARWLGNRDSGAWSKKRLTFTRTIPYL